MRIRNALAALAIGACATTTGAGAASAAPARTTTMTPVTGVIDSCEGFDVIADLLLRQTLTTYPDGSETVHLRLTGTAANSVSGRTGTYAEIQIDKARSDGSAFSAGLLSKLVVPGRGAVSLYVGRVSFAPDGTVTFTPHAAGVDDGAAFHDKLCDALR